MATKVFEAKVYLEGTSGPVPVQVQARDIPDARRIIQAQYGSRFKRFANGPLEVKK
ncbi:MAG: hypothetical protein IT428_03330 [Planctomycetaceae bacterium]|nr:hypothetical protein [Planctomycetaceae bacterium]